MSELERKALAAIAQGLRNLADQLDSILTGGKEAEVYDKLPWEQREGSKGPFQVISKKACNNSDLYRHLFNIVKVNTADQGEFAHRIGDYYYWLDTRDNPPDPTAIFRRKKRTKE